MKNPSSNLGHPGSGVPFPAKAASPSGNSVATTALAAGAIERGAVEMLAAAGAPGIWMGQPRGEVPSLLNARRNPSTPERRISRSGGPSTSSTTTTGQPGGISTGKPGRKSGSSRSRGWQTKFGTSGQQTEAARVHPLSQHGCSSPPQVTQVPAAQALPAEQVDDDPGAPQQGSPRWPHGGMQVKEVSPAQMRSPVQVRLAQQAWFSPPQGGQVVPQPASGAGCAVCGASFPPPHAAARRMATAAGRRPMERTYRTPRWWRTADGNRYLAAALAFAGSS